MSQEFDNHHGFQSESSLAGIQTAEKLGAFVRQIQDGNRTTETVEAPGNIANLPTRTIDREPGKDPVITTDFTGSNGKKYEMFDERSRQTGKNIDLELSVLHDDGTFWKASPSDKAAISEYKQILNGFDIMPKKSE